MLNLKRYTDNEKSCDGVEWVEGKGGFFFSSCVWCGQWTFHAKLFLWLFVFGGEVGKGPKQRVPSSTSLLSHMLWQMLSSFHP